MKKWWIALALIFVLLNGCGKTDEEDIVYLDGFEKAEYEKYNSYASENGLAGTLIYIEGKVIEQIEEESDDLGILLLIVEQDDGKKWCVGVPGEDEIEEINEQNVRIYGEYQGYSQVHNLPAMMVDTEDGEKIEQARIDIYNESGFTTVWRFSEYVDEYYDKIANYENDTEEETKKESTSIKMADKKLQDQKETEEDGTEEGKKAENVETEKDVEEAENAETEKDVEEAENVETEKEVEETEKKDVEPTITLGQSNALKQAKKYLELMEFSYQGLIEQLEYEQYTHEEAVYAADNCGADWKEEAAEKAERYLEVMSFSREGLIEQLKYDGFTAEEAEYAAGKVGY